MTMKRFILSTAICLSLFTAPVLSQTTIRLKFTDDQTRRTVAGKIKGVKYTDYVFRVRPLTTIEVTLAPVNKGLRYAVYSPIGFLIDDDSDGENFIGFAEKGGDYTVRIYGSGKKTIRYKLSVALFQ